ncbi:hypothetical protein OSTOST_17354 [Ostertagia ostertagi]
MTNRFQPTTNVSYNCVDRHMSQPDFKHETALLWTAIFWDDGVHDYADLSWDVVEVLTNKIANNPVTTTTSQLTELIKETCPKLIVTVDAFWQGHDLIETKQRLDEAVSKAQITSIKRILVIRHTAPNKGVPPPDEVYPGKRPCYKISVSLMSFELNDEIDVEWRKEIIKANTECDPVNPVLSLRTVSTKQLLIAAQELGSLVTTDCLSLPHPQTSLGLVGCVASMAVWEDSFNVPCNFTYKKTSSTIEHRSLPILSSPEFEEFPTHFKE